MEKSLIAIDKNQIEELIDSLTFLNNDVLNKIGPLDFDSSNFDESKLGLVQQLQFYISNIKIENEKNDMHINHIKEYYHKISDKSAELEKQIQKIIEIDINIEFRSSLLKEQIETSRDKHSEALINQTTKTQYRLENINQNILTIKKEFENIKKLMNKSLKIILISLITTIFFATCFFIVDFFFLDEEEIIKHKPIAAIKNNVEKSNVEPIQNKIAAYDFSAKISQEEFKAQNFDIYRNNYEKVGINFKDFSRNDVINGFRFIRANSEGRILFVDQNNKPVWITIK